MLLQDTVRKQAQLRPESVAIVSDRQRMSYGELEESGNRLAHLLKEAGCRGGDRIGLLLPKSVPALVGMLGTLKADCIYVPMDTASPAPRLAKIVEACEPAFILSSGGSTGLLNALRANAPAGNSFKVGWLESGKPVGNTLSAAFSWDDLASMPSTAVESNSDPEDAAHILFTSGSTGTPKGVVIKHSNVIHFLNWAKQFFGAEASDRISCHPPLHFDLSTFDIWGSFLAGSQLYLVPHEVSMLPHKVADFIRRNELTQWFSVPSALKYMAQFDVVRQNDFSALKRLLWCGEALPTPTLIYWMNRLPNVTFTNLYGPTETTIASSYYTVPRCPQNENVEIPIGHGCDGEDLLVLDDTLQPLGPGEVGDLYIRGVGLSPGYWRDPEKTRSVFISDPRHGRIYKTGDLARTGGGGLVYLLGRADTQIKSRGYRIELGEIEAALNALGSLRESAVVAVRTDGFEGMTICCAYVPPVATPTVSQEISPSDLRQSLAAVLPSYMLPSQWLALESLPLNANGKIDRPRLREHFLQARTAA